MKVIFIMYRGNVERKNLIERWEKESKKAGLFEFIIVFTVHLLTEILTTFILTTLGNDIQLHHTN